MKITKEHKTAAHKKFEGYDQLFNSCWRQYREWLRGAIDDPTCQEDIDSWLDTIAKEKVNNEKSPFYMHGEYQPLYGDYGH